jgi:hypothetical protein
MRSYIVYVLGFFVPIALAAGAGYLAGRSHERQYWIKFIAGLYQKLDVQLERDEPWRRSIGAVEGRRKLDE